MKESKNVWEAFQGCFVAVSPYFISIGLGIATWYFMKSLAFHPFVVWTTAINIGMSAFVLACLLIKKIGDLP